MDVSVPASPDPHPTSNVSAAISDTLNETIRFIIKLHFDFAKLSPTPFGELRLKTIICKLFTNLKQDEKDRKNQLK